MSSCLEERHGWLLAWRTSELYRCLSPIHPVYHLALWSCSGPLPKASYLGNASVRLPYSFRPLKKLSICSSADLLLPRRFGHPRRPYSGSFWLSFRWITLHWAVYWTNPLARLVVGILVFIMIILLFVYVPARLSLRQLPCWECHLKSLYTAYLIII